MDAKDVVTEGLMHSMKHSLEELEPATDYEAEVQIKNQFMWGETQQFAFSTRKGRRCSGNTVWQLVKMTHISGDMMVKETHSNKIQRLLT